MEYLFLSIALFTGIVKVISVKNCGKLCPGEYNSVRINAARAFVSVIVSAAVFFVTGVNAKSDFWWICLISGVSNAVLMFVWVLCTQRAGLALVESFGLVGSVALPLVLAPVLYEGETVSLLQWIGLMCLFVAVIAISSNSASRKTSSGEGRFDASIGQINSREREKNASAKIRAKGSTVLTVFYLALYVISNAAVSVTPKLYVFYAGKGYEAFFNLATFIVVAFCFSAVLLFGRVFFKKRVICENVVSGKKVLLFVAIASVTVYAYQYFLTLSSGLPSAVLYPFLRGGNIVCMVLCDAVLYKRKITFNVFLGVAFALASIILTSL